MPQSLLPYLLCLVLPLLVMVINALRWEYRTGFGSMAKNSSTHELDDLIDTIPKLHLDVKLPKTVHDITHAIVSRKERNVIFFYHGKSAIQPSTTMDGLLQINFIRYSKNLWVNRHWVKKVKTNQLELLNGIELSKEET